MICVENARQLIEIASRANAQEVGEAARRFGYTNYTPEGLTNLFRGDGTGSSGAAALAQIWNFRIAALAAGV